mmetsp:Transcript_6274/g.13466  ORF Transcript_6274/g.13466 Transcript_6274/m.13466 type:complete len:279 (-) Transcript_6274:88-924(-)
MGRPLKLVLPGIRWAGFSSVVRLSFRMFFCRLRTFRRFFLDRGYSPLSPVFFSPLATVLSFAVVVAVSLIVAESPVFGPSFSSETGSNTSILLLPMLVPLLSDISFCRCRSFFPSFFLVFVLLSVLLLLSSILFGEIVFFFFFFTIVVLPPFSSSPPSMPWSSTPKSSSSSSPLSRDRFRPTFNTCLARISEDTVAVLLFAAPTPPRRLVTPFEWLDLFPFVVLFADVASSVVVPSPPKNLSTAENPELSNSALIVVFQIWIPTIAKLMMNRIKLRLQ